MQRTQALLSELQREGTSTRKMLERVPDNHADWRPHPKSMPLMQLATHIAEIPGIFVSNALLHDELDFTDTKHRAPRISATAALVAYFDETFQNAVQTLQSATDEHLTKTWSMRNGEKIFMTLPKIAVIRTIGFNHLIHHRGQLSVYLRLLEVPVPGMYGPSADESFLS